MRSIQNALLRLVFSLVLLLVLVGTGLAETKLDTSFGNKGFVVKDLGNGDDEILAIAQQTDGKLVLAGYYDNGAVKNLALARYLNTGELDSDFNNGGIFTHSLGNGNSVATGVVIQKDGKIVVAGAMNDGSHQIAVIRVTTDGFLDNSFADNGQLLLTVDAGEVSTNAMKMASDGTFFLAGTITKDAAPSLGFIAKITADGKTDDTFGTGGITYTPFSYDTDIRAIALLADGKTLISGSFATKGIAKAGLMRLNENGSIDATFGTSGQLMLALGDKASIVHDIELDTALRILLVGQVDNGTFTETFVGRLNEDGTADTTFAASGYYRSDLAYANAGQALAVRIDGAILVVGSSANTTGQDIFMLTLKETFSPALSAVPPTALANQQVEMTATFAFADLAEKDDVGRALTVFSDGTVFAAGSTGNGTDKDIALLRFIETETLQALTSGTTTSGWRSIITKEITDITRVGASSGGFIAEFDNSACIASCSDACSTSAYAGCYNSCFSSCAPTVTKRGVVYGIKENPVYDDDADKTTLKDEDQSENQVEDQGGDQGEDTPSIFPASGSYAYDLVKSGQTEDGEGTGSYDSEIIEITPNTLYHVRAYAVLSDNTVIYGNELTFETNDACFIATAAFGSLLDPRVSILREFRDQVMMSSQLGRRLVGMYYIWSPHLADLVAEHEILKTMVRIVLWPIVALVFFLLKTGWIAKILLLAAGVIVSTILMKTSKKVQVIRL